VTSTSSLPPLARSALLGAATGIRSQLPLALLARAASRGEITVGDGAPLGWLRHQRTAQLTAFSAIGETIGDKLPFVPARTQPGPLLGRIAFGSLVGAIATRAQGEAALPGAVVGAVTGGLLAVGATRARAALGKQTGIPDIVLGLVEDAITLGVSVFALPRHRP